MESAPLDFLKQLLHTPSPSGYEERIQSVVRDYVGSFADKVTTDLHGNVIVGCNIDAPLRVMFAGHCDQIGMLVSYIDGDGYIYAQTIGGWDPQQLIGQRMTIWADSGAVAAVIARKPIHLLTDEERKQVVKTKDLWLDIGAKDKDEAQSVVRVGDPITLQLGFQEMRNDLANAPGMDDKTGLWVVIEGLRRAQQQKKLNCAAFAVSTVQEEIGLRGARTSAYGIDPHVGIAVDVTHATDCPTIDKREQGEVRIGNGPVVYRGPNMNHAVVDQLIRVAEKNERPYQLSAIGRATSNDANTIQVSRQGVATAVVAIPNRYMHSAVETISLNDIDQAANLLADFLVSLTGDEDFTPSMKA
ncbi:MAG: M42 family metallopeptidase [Pirellulaceae bacterium]|nr:M42 family metallopeptidase [Planctomycetales bacterium]